MEIIIDKIQTICRKKKYWFPDTSRPGNCFLFGIRAKEVNQWYDEFNDVLGIAVVEKGGTYSLFGAAGTTDPGRSELTNPTFARAQRDGTAIMKPGQYRGCYILDYHGTGQWRHRAFRQVGPIAFYSDPDRDTILEFDERKVQSEVVGLNFHAAAKNVDLKEIGPYSAGCQVVRDYDEFQKIVSIAERQIQLLGVNSFSYTLFTQSEFELFANIY